MADINSLDLNFYLNIFFFSILGLGVFIGYVKGFKKSFYTFAVMLCFYAFFFLTIDWVVQILWKLPMPWLGSAVGDFYPELAEASSFEDVITIMLSKYMGENLAGSLANEEFKIFISSTAMFFMKIVYTILYFFIFKYIYKFFFFMVRVIFFRSNKDKTVSKQRGLGAFCGLLRAGVFLYVILIFVGGFMNIGENSLKFLPENEQTAPIKKVVTEYHNNPVVYSVSMLEVKKDYPLNLYLYDSVFSINYKDKKISFRKEIETGVKIYDVYEDSQFKTTYNLSDITGEEIEEVFNYLSESELFITALPLGIEVAAEQFNTEMTVPKEELYEIDWSKEVSQLGEVAVNIFKFVNIIRTSQNEGGLVTEEFTGDDVRALFNSLSQSELAKLGAYVAMEPLLKQAGSNISAFITVPKDLDWEDEYVAIGEIAGAIIDTGVTIGELNSGNPSVLIAELADLDFTIILDSKIISQALINILSGKANINGFNIFQVPPGVVWEDEYDDYGNLINNGELRNALMAISAIVKVTGNVNFEDLNLNLISEFTDDTIDTIFNSAIFVATISNLLNDMGFGDTVLIVPNEVYDNNNYIIKDELKSLAKSVKTVFDKLACDEGDTQCASTGFDIGKAFTLGDDLDDILSSKIIEATLGKLIYDQGNGILRIPNNSLKTITDKNGEKVIVSNDNGEIKKLFDAVSIFDFTNFDNMQFNASIIQKLAVEKDGKKELDEAKKNTLFASSIIHATLSHMLLDLTGSMEGSSQVLVVPYKNESNNDIRYTSDGMEYVSTAELSEILEAVIVLNIDDFNNVTTLGLGAMISNMDELLDSAILHATISDQILKIQGISVPYVDDKLDTENNEVKIRKVVGDEGRTTEYIIRDELVDLFDVLEILGNNDISGFTGDVNFSLFYGDIGSVGYQNRTKLLSSAIIQATISKQLIDLDLNDNILIVPTKTANGDPLIVNRGPLGQETTYVIEEEFHHLLNIFEAMGYNSIKDFTGLIDTQKFFDHKAIILDSAIFHATISDYMLNPNSGVDNVLVIPDNCRIEQESTTYVRDEEITDILTILENVGIKDFNNVNLEASVIRNVQPDILLASESIQATISKTVLAGAKDETNRNPGELVLIVPRAVRENIYVKGVLSTQIKYDELLNMLEAIRVIGIDNFNEDLANKAELITGKGRTDLELLLASDSIHLSFENMLSSNTNISIPDVAKDALYIGTPFEIPSVTTKEHLVDFILAAKVISDNFTSASFSMENMKLIVDGRDTIIASLIVRHNLTIEIKDKVPYMLWSDWEQKDGIFTEDAFRNEIFPILDILF